MLSFFSFFVSGVIVDRVLKYWASLTLPGHPIILWPGVFELRAYRNFTFLFSPIDSTLIIFSVSIVVLVFLIVLGIWLDTWSTAAGKVGYALLLAGAGSNLFDRLFQGYILDYVRIVNVTVFNFADILIVIGLIILLIAFIRRK